MTVVFKSDVKADSSANIANFVGYSGPSDFYAYADISNNIYKKNGLNVSLNDVLKSPGQKAFPALVDKLGNVETSPAGVARRSFVPAHGVFAVMAETSNSGFVSSIDTITISTNTSIIYAAYATKGAISIDTSAVNLIAGAGTSTDPYLFKYKNSTNIGYTKDRIDAVAVCIQCVSNRVPLSIVKERDIVFDSDLDVSIDGVNKTQFTIVLRVISPKISPAAGATSGYVPIIKFIESASKTVSYVKVRNTSLNIQTRENGVEKGTAEEAGPVTSVVDTYAISFSNGDFRHYMNGAKVNTPDAIKLSSFALNELKLLSNDNVWGVPKNNDALVNLIIYNRALSNEELANCLFK